jgi:hypothetical protein
MNPNLNIDPNRDNPYQAPYQAPRQRGSRAALYTSIGAAGLAAVGLVTALVLGLGGSSTASASSTPEHQQTHSDVRPAVLPTPTPTPTPAPAPAVAPSPTIRLLQTQLAQLNYYMGPINGIDSPAVHQGISYLQRDADLPITGQLTPATQSALSRMMIQGNNQMSGNS